MKKPWLTSEVRLLRQHYPAGGAGACAAYLPGRTPLAIHKRARIERVSSAQGVRLVASQALHHLQADGALDRAMLANAIRLLLREAVRKAEAV